MGRGSFPILKGTSLGWTLTAWNNNWLIKTPPTGWYWGGSSKTLSTKKKTHIFFFPSSVFFSRRSVIFRPCQRCVCVFFPLRPKRLHEVCFVDNSHDELNLITHGIAQWKFTRFSGPTYDPKHGKKQQLHESWESAPQCHISRKRDYEAHHHPRKKKAVLSIHEWTKRRQKTQNQPPPHCRPANLHHPSPQRPQSFQGLDEILWSKPPGESWCNGSLFWGSKRLVFWSGCIWIQLICDQVSPYCWLACRSLMVSSRCSIGGTLTMGQDKYTYYIVGKSIYHKNFVSFREDFTLVTVWRLISHFVLSVTSIKQTPFFWAHLRTAGFPPNTRASRRAWRYEGLGDCFGAKFRLLTLGMSFFLQQDLLVNFWKEQTSVSPKKSSVS